MSMRTPICELLGIQVPIFAFTRSREVVAAVSRAGGLGVLGAVAFTPEELETELQWLDANLGGLPYGVDIVMPASYVGAETGGITKEALDKMIPEAQRAFVEEMLRRYEVPPLPADAPEPPSLLGWSHEAGRSHVDVALRHPTRLLANALGPPPPDVVERAHAQGVKVAALIGTVAQAKKQVAAGVDIIVAVGTEAGGHTGEVGTMVIVPDVVDAVHPTPVLAAGGIGSGRQVAASLALGAQGVWTGSIWLTVEEGGSHPALIEKMLRAGASDTVRSKCISGKPARQLKTAWTEAWDGKDSPGTLPMPLQYMAVSDATARIYRAADLPGSRARELIGTPVGQIVGRMNEVRPARAVMESLIEECRTAAERVKAITGG
jgi:NAD(P)H-dependent flavin oxidoreductase YrpB (nitropropane dioxygenase family)